MASKSSKTPDLDREQTDTEKKLLGLVIETSPDGLVIIDEDGVIRSFNPSAERMFGYKAGEIIGRNVSCLMPSPEAENHDAYVKHYLESGKKNIIGIGREVTARKKNGNLFPVELAVGEIVDGDRHLFTGFIRDLTENRHSEKQKELLREFEKASTEDTHPESHGFFARVKEFWSS